MLSLWKARFLFSKIRNLSNSGKRLDRQGWFFVEQYLKKVQFTGTGIAYLILAPVTFTSLPLISCAATE